MYLAVDVKILFTSLDIPIMPAITAKITFQEFAFRSDIKPQLFEIPPHFIEDPTR